MLKQLELKINVDFKTVLPYAIAIFSVSAFMIRGIGMLDRIMHLMAVGIILVYLLFHFIYVRTPFSFKMNYSRPILLMLLSSVLAAFAAQHYHNQNIGLTLYTQRYLYFFLFYYMLHIFKPSPKYVRNLILVVALLHSMVFLAQVAVYPVRITDAKIMVERGTLRIFLPGMSFRFLAYFMCIDVFLRTKNLKYLMLALIFLSVAFLTASRQILALFTLLTLADIVMSKQIKNKIVLLGMIAIMGMAAALAFSGVVEGMLEANEKNQRDREGDGDVRARAIKFYLNDFQEARGTYVFGNGLDNLNSPYGRKLAHIKIRKGYYCSDIGIVGLYVVYGLLFALCILYALIYTVSRKMHFSLTYVRLFFFFIIGRSVTDQIEFSGGQGAVLLCCLFYTVDYYDHIKLLANETIKKPSRKLKQLIKDLPR
ncbi:hypothetical protein OAO55_02905 [Bacteroidales bacterium]|nr:hypothetical protein [Bacteroidales bacterium]